MGKLNDSLKKLGKGLTGNDIVANKLGAIIEETAEGVAEQGGLNTKADLVGGKVPASQLPSYVDDIVEGYLYEGAFYEDAEHENEIDGEQGKIYVDLATNLTYRWSGSLFVQVNDVDLSNYYTKSEIVANPTLAGTESELEGLQIGSTKYKMPSGGNEIELIDLSLISNGTLNDLITALNWDGSTTEEKTIDLKFKDSTNNIYKYRVYVKLFNGTPTGQSDNITLEQIIINGDSKITYSTSNIETDKSTSLKNIFVDNPQHIYKLIEMPLDGKQYIVLFGKNQQNKPIINKFEIPSQGAVTYLTNYYGSLQFQSLLTLPAKPSDTTKTYVLKCVNGVLTWVEEQA